MPETNSSTTNQPVSLADEEAVKEILVNTMFSLWDVVNNLSRLKPSRQDQYRVTIFGSARAKPGTYAYDEVKRIATALAAIGCDIITGGGPGLMQAANEGAAHGDQKNQGQSVGIRVDLPFEQELNPLVLQAFEHRTFFTRLHQFVLMSDAFVVVPGGIGTVLELMMIWQLLQVQHVRETPLILVGTNCSNSTIRRCTMIMPPGTTSKVLTHQKTMSLLPHFVRNMERSVSSATPWRLLISE